MANHELKESVRGALAFRFFLYLSCHQLMKACFAAQHVPSRTGTDCMIQWKNEDDPRINKQPWTRAEDKRLVELAEQMQGHDWTVIAQRLDVRTGAFFRPPLLVSAVRALNE